MRLLSRGDASECFLWLDYFCYAIAVAVSMSLLPCRSRERERERVLLTLALDTPNRIISLLPGAIIFLLLVAFR